MKKELIKVSVALSSFPACFFSQKQFSLSFMVASTLRFFFAFTTMCANESPQGNGNNPRPLIAQRKTSAYTKAQVSHQVSTRSQFEHVNISP